MKEMPRLPRITTDRILYGLLGIISVAAFCVSFAALSELARANDMAFPFLFPVIVDAAALGFSVAAYRASVANRPEWKYSALVLGFTGISAVLNCAHVWEGWTAGLILKYSLHGMPPVVAYLILEVLLSEVRHRETATTPKASRAIPATVANANEEPEPMAPKRRGRKPGSKTAIGPDGVPITRAEIAKREGIPLRTLYRNLARSAA